MEETLKSDSVKKHLRMQNEVLKWLADFSEKLHHKAKDTTMEVNGLLEEVGTVELDLKNTTNTLWDLSRNLPIDHKISDESDNAHSTTNHSDASAQPSIPAQDYENDILPRYKQALSLGLTSCKKYFQSTGRSQRGNSLFRTGSAYGPLPHIIGSEEFIHDNSCGIAEDSLSLRSSQLDFGLVLEPKQPSTAEELDSPNLFSPDMFGIQRGSSEKDLTYPLTSAASDFKAMLEAALLNPYKFWLQGRGQTHNPELHYPDDDESISMSDVRGKNKMNTGQTHKDVVGPSGEHKAVFYGTRTSEQLNSIVEEDKIVTEENFLRDSGAHELFSSLVGGSLFEEDLLSSDQNNCADISSNSVESSSQHPGVKYADELVEGTHSLTINETFGDSGQCLITPAGQNNLICNNEVESGQAASVEEVNFQKDTKQTTLEKPEDNGSALPEAICDDTTVMEPCETDSNVFDNEVRTSSQYSVKEKALRSLVAEYEDNSSNNVVLESTVNDFKTDEGYLHGN